MSSIELAFEGDFQEQRPHDDEIDLSKLETDIGSLEAVMGQNGDEFEKGLDLINTVVKEHRDHGEKISTKGLVEKLTRLCIHSRIKFSLIASMLVFLIGASCRSSSSNSESSLATSPDFERDNSTPRSSEVSALVTPLGQNSGNRNEYEKVNQVKFDFWQIARLKLETDHATGISKFENAVPYGERGYVFGLYRLSLPYEVAGYKFVEVEDAGAGVTLYWYRVDSDYASPYSSESALPYWRMCDPSENVFEEGMVGEENASEGMTYVWNTETGKYDGPFHSVNPGETGYTDPLLPGGNIAGFYPGCALDLGSGGRYYFYHPVDIGN